MDGDGSNRSSQGKRSVRYSTSSRRLANDIVELVNSLGGTATQSWQPGRRGHSEEGMMSIMAPEGMSFFSGRKDVEINSRYKTIPKRSIVKIEIVGQDEHRCISVAAEDNLYLANSNYIVTHNTSVMINCMHRMIKQHKDIKILFVSLEQQRNEWFERARRIHGFYNPYLHYDEINGETVNFYKNNLALVDKNRVSIEELKSCVFQTEDELGSKLDIVIVDYLGYFARGFKGEPYIRTSDAVMGLKQVAKETDVAIITPHQVNRGSKAGTSISISDARDSGTVEETGDFVFSIGSNDFDPGKGIGDATGEFNISILKSRHGGLGMEAKIQVSPVSLSYVPYVDSLYGPEFLEQSLKERICYKRGEHDYERMFARHTEHNYNETINYGPT